MVARLTVVFLLVALATACGTTRAVSLDTGHNTPIVHFPQAAESGPVEMMEREFTQGFTDHARQVKPSANPEQAARKLLDVSPRSGWYGFSGTR